jgi:hypothetical protein
MFKLNLVNIKSALVYGLLSAILEVCIAMISVGDVFNFDWHALLNAGVFGFLIVFVSLIKNLLTSDSGNFVGVIKVTQPEVK